MESKKVARAASFLLGITTLFTACGAGGAVPHSLASLLSGGGSTAEPLSFAWPPVRGEAYPDVTLLNQDGERVSLSSFRGKVILVELAGMT